MKVVTQYWNRVRTLLEEILSTQGDAIQSAARLLADAIERDQLIHVFGTGGHSVMGAEEMFYRAGGLVPVNAVLDEGVLLAHGALRSTLVERTPGYAPSILRYYDLSAGEVLIIVNAYGVNACTIDAAEYAREVGAYTIGVTSVQHQRELPLDHPARHPSRKNLCDLVDICIDSRIPIGDAVVEIPGVSQKVGAVSTFANALIMNALTLETVRELAQRGIDPPIWQSANSPGGEEANRRHVERYKHRIKKL